MNEAHNEERQLVGVILGWQTIGNSSITSEMMSRTVVPALIERVNAVVAGDSLDPMALLSAAIDEFIPVLPPQLLCVGIDIEIDGVLQPTEALVFEGDEKRRFYATPESVRIVPFDDLPGARPRADVAQLTEFSAFLNSLEAP